MLKWRLCLIFVVVVCHNSLGMSEKQMKAAAKLVRNACQPKTKATDEMIDNMHKGIWNGDQLEKSKKNGELDYDNIIAQVDTLPDTRKDATKASLDNCVGLEVVDDKCDNAWRIGKCLYMDNPSNCLARAIYDNNAEAQDELTFRKGDVLTVLEQNTSNMEGWWLCSLRGRQGICPGNRLRLIPGYYEDPSRGPSPQFTDIHSTHHSTIPNDMNCLERQGKRRSWHVQPNKVITPRRYNDVYLYDMPPSRCSPIPVHSLSPSCQSQASDYDVPPKAVPLHYDPRHYHHRCSPALSCISPISKDSQDSYDVPKPLLLSQNMLTPSSSASSLSLTGESFSSSNRSSLINMPDYDVPRSYPKGPQLVLHAQQPVYDVPPSASQIKELPLEISPALDALERLQSETTSVISRLLSFVSPDWRTLEKLETTILDIKLVVIRLKTSLHDFREFCEGALGNATRATDKNLASKLVNLVLTLKNADKLFHDATDKLEYHNWDVRLLSRSNNDEDKYKPDELEQIISCTRSLTEDIRQAASFIQGNSTLLFKKDSVPVPPPDNIDHPEDYDYVNFESKEAYAKANSELRDELPKELRKNFDCMVKNVDESVLCKEMHPDDKQILTFFAHQTTAHHNNLTQAIDAFLQTVEHNQPPKMFLAHGKFVVLSAHKLVHIGDTVSRGVSNAEMKARSMNCANALSEALAISVSKTKQAALQFPSVTAVQEMVDSIVDISHLAKDLKMCLVQAAQP